jgi:hypothetical protein
LWDLKRSETDVGSELDHQVIPLAGGGPAEILDLLVGEPDFRLATAGGFESHTGLLSFRDNIFNPWQKLAVLSG